LQGGTGVSFAVDISGRGRLLTYTGSQQPHNQMPAPGSGGTTTIYLPGTGSWTTLFTEGPLNSDNGTPWVPIAVSCTVNSHTQILWEGYYNNGSANIPEVAIWDIAPSGAFSGSQIWQLPSGWYPDTMVASPLTKLDGNVRIVFHNSSGASSQWVVNPTTFGIVDNVAI
jgi:hypothetical protein